MVQEKGKNMAQDKGKNIVTEPPMNPPRRLSSPVPSGTKPRGCQGDGCGSDPDTWPLHRMIRGGAHCFLCCSCVLLSQRSLYCCRCFFLVTSPSNDNPGDWLTAPPVPTITCRVCRRAVAHLPCIYHEAADAADALANDAFICPACTAAQNGELFTYAPRCLQPIDEIRARILVLAGRIALVLLKRHAAAARENAKRLALEARDARKIAVEALDVAYDLAKKEDPSWVPPQSPQNDLAEGGGMEAEANVVEGLRLRLNAIPSLAKLTIGGTAGASSSVVPTLALTEAAQAEPREHQALNSFNVKEVATAAAAEAARDSPSAPQTLQLFPGAMPSSSTKMPRTAAKKPRTKRLRTLQLFKKGM